jgi:hypothetical protein
VYVLNDALRAKLSSYPCTHDAREHGYVSCC